MIAGFIVVDKPAGITSHDVVNRVRRILGTRRVGHTGTLDPFATGVLPIAVNDGTKIIPFLDEGVKVYEALLRLGVTTDTLDMTGAILSESDSSGITISQFNACLTSFSGVISQVPPMFSAIKQGGQPLYKLARKGVEVERKPREVEIHKLELLSYNLPFAAIRVTCSRGAYVRTLADDMGKALGSGAALQELRRTASGPFTLSRAVTLEALEESASQGGLNGLLITPEIALDHIPEITLDGAGLNDIRHGRAITYPSGTIHLEPDSLVRLTYSGELASVASVSDCEAGIRIAPKRVFPDAIKEV